VSKSDDEIIPFTVGDRIQINTLAGTCQSLERDVADIKGMLKDAMPKLYALCGIIGLFELGKAFIKP
jgi:hypothetical protein